MAILRVDTENIYSNWKGHLGKRQILTHLTIVLLHFNPALTLSLLFYCAQLKPSQTHSSHLECTWCNSFHAIKW